MTRLVQPVLADCLRSQADRFAVFDDLNSETRFQLLRQWTASTHARITSFARSLGKSDCDVLAAELGIDPAVETLGLEVFAPRITSRTTVGGGRVFIPLVQRRDLTSDGEHPNGARVRSGSTVVIKFGSWEIEHIVVKSVRPR
jgi:hypothetical protein